MKDTISENRLAQLHPKAITPFKEFIEKCESELNITLRIAQGLRTIQQQNDLYVIGRTMMGANPTDAHPMGETVTQAVGGYSYHNYGLAIDIVVLKDGKVNWHYDYHKLASLMPAEMNWGGNFTKKDMDHFEIPFGHTVTQLLTLLHEGKVNDGWVVL